MRFFLFIFIFIFQWNTAYSSSTVSLPQEMNTALETLCTNDKLNTSKLQKDIIKLLREKSKTADNKTTFTYTCEDYTTPIQNYISGAKEDPANFSFRVLQILQFAHTYLSKPETEAKSLGIYTIYSLIKALRDSSPPQQTSLLFIVGKAWLVPCMAYPETLSDRNISKLFTEAVEDHIILARTRGKAYYPYACDKMETFIPRYYRKDKAAQGRCYYWLAWMYLNHNQYAQSIAAAKKVPDIDSMKDTQQRFTKWANDQEKTQRKSRKNK